MNFLICVHFNNFKANTFSIVFLTKYPHLKKISSKDPPFYKIYNSRKSETNIATGSAISKMHYSRKPYLKKSTIVINWMFKNISSRNWTIKSQASTNFGIYIWICYSGTMHLNGYCWQHRAVHLLPQGLRCICAIFYLIKDYQQCSISARAIQLLRLPFIVAFSEYQSSDACFRQQV